MSIDIATITAFAPAASELLAPIASKLTSLISTIGQDKWQAFTHSFDSYLIKASEKHKLFNSPVFSHEGKLLEDYYIPLTLHRDESAGKRRQT